MQWPLIKFGATALTHAKAPAVLPTSAFAPPVQMSTAKEADNVLS